jgi:hypothetical protein
MPLAAKIAITVIVVAWTVFLCTIGRWSLSSFYDSIFCRKGNLMGDFVFTEDGEIRPVRIVIVYGVMLALMWLA